jgi:glycine dehydrogenase subunit 1
MFHEQALRLPIPVAEGLRILAAHGILGGYSLGQDYPELGDALLVCATELRTNEDLTLYRDALARIIAAQSTPQCKIPR